MTNSEVKSKEFENRGKAVIAFVCISHMTSFVCTGATDNLCNLMQLTVVILPFYGILLCRFVTYVKWYSMP